MEKPKEIFELEKIIKKELNKVDKLDSQNMSYVIEDNIITGLSLPHCNIESIAFIENYPDLTDLILADNQIEDISPIRNLKKLRAFDIQSNRIKELKEILDVPYMESLNISYNLVEKIKSINQWPNLEYLDLTANPIENYSFLKEIEYRFSLHILNSKTSNNYFTCIISNRTISRILS